MYITCCVTAEADNADKQYISRGAIYKIKYILLLFLHFICVLLTKLSACMKYRWRAIHKLHKVWHATYLAPESSQPSTCCPVELSLQPARMSEWTYTNRITCCNNLHSYQVFINKMLLYYQSPLTGCLQLYTVWHQFILIHAKNYIPVKIYFCVSSLLGLDCKTDAFFQVLKCLTYLILWL